MRLGSDALAQWNLLSNVIPIFKHALHRAAHDKVSRRHFPIIRGQLEAIGIELFQESHLQYDLSEEKFSLLRRAYEPLLSAFEEIVTDDVLQQFPHCNHNQLVDHMPEIEVPEAIAKCETCQYHNQTEFPKLNALSNLTQAHENKLNHVKSERPQSDLASYVQFARSADELIKFKRRADLFIEVVEDVFVESFEERIETDPNQIVNITSHELAGLDKIEEFSKAARTLFSLLVDGCQSCPTKSTMHSTKLRLGKFDRLRWDLLLSSCGNSDYWHPTICTHSREVKLHNPSTNPNVFCHKVRRSRQRRQNLHLLFNESQLLDGPICEHSETIVRPISGPSVITLKELLQEDRQNRVPGKPWSNFDPGERRRIAAILACSILFLYDSSWLHNVNGDEIYFVCESDGVESRHLKGPYVKRSLSTTSDRDNSCPDPLHEYPIVAEFGIFLCEFESGQVFQQHEDDRDYDTKEFSLFLMLQRILQQPSVQRGVEFGYLSVIKACLEFDELVNAVQHPKLNEETKCRAAILKHILKPLVYELKRTYPQAAADLSDIPQYLFTTSATNFNADSEARSHSVPDQVISNSKFALREQVPIAHSRLRFSQAPSVPSPLRSPVPIGESSTFVPVPLTLFEGDGVIVIQENEKISRCQTFVRLFDSFLTKYMKPDNLRRRTRIAVLDTGIDEEDDAFLYQRRKLIQQRTRAGTLSCDPIQGQENFVGGEDVDTNGHGTHIATLLMRYAPQADLLIAKIANMSSIKDVDHISKAIDWAVRQQVDIITMSWGMSDTSVAWATRDKIETAMVDATRAKILLFAAASNCAGNGPRAYPASDTNVICVHASDGVGHDDGGLNPPMDTYTDRLATLGVAMNFSWFGKNSYRSGTSYATPMLAAIAANVLDYVTYAVREGWLEQEVLDRLRRQRGMRKMFHFMSSRINGAHDYVAPWKLWTERATDESICSKLRTEL